MGLEVEAESVRLYTIALLNIDPASKSLYSWKCKEKIILLSQYCSYCLCVEQFLACSSSGVIPK